MAESIEVYEFLDLSGQAKECGIHDVGKETGQCLHVIAGLAWRGACHPIIFRCLDKIVDL